MRTLSLIRESGMYMLKLTIVCILVLASSTVSLSWYVKKAHPAVLIVAFPSTASVWNNEEVEIILK